MAGTVCIVNPYSGGGQTGRRWPSSARRLAEAGLSFETRETCAAGEATTLAREALQAGADTIVAVGGDGTIHEIVNGFFADGRAIAPEARLGILPAGSGSDLIKTLGIPADADGAIARLRRGETRVVDLGLARFATDAGEASRYYINTASLGLSGAVLVKMRTLPSFVGGSAAYMLGSVSTLFEFKPFALTLELEDGTRREEQALFVVAGNGRYFGAGMQALPEARMDDGLLDVVLLRPMPLWELLLNFPRIYAGSHLALPAVAHWRTRRLSVTTATPQPLEIDGEQPGVTPASFEILPGALRVIA
ncbi:MAG TPA: diacylglycerol kinase family protein [Oscillatoriaceae cyanobacterium]